MTRVKRGKTKNKKRKRILKKTKGYRHRRNSHKRAAKEALTHAGRNAYRDRKRKKRERRRKWQVIINAALTDTGMSYSRFIHQLKENDIQLDRKVLAELAKNKPDAFASIVETVS
jgi:large subunit ribosomal protein L20